MTSNPWNIPTGSSAAGPDAAAFEALVAAGFDPSRVAPEHRARAGRAAALLALLEPRSPKGAVEAVERIERRATLIDVTIARAIQCGPPMSAGSMDASAELAPADGAAVEALVGGGWSPERVGVGRSRAEQAAAVLALLDGASFGAAERSNRVQDTFDRILVARGGTGVGESEIRPYTGSSFRLRDMVAVAASLFIAMVIGWPTLVATRESARQAACASNMASAGLGFGLYAGDHRGLMPRNENNVAGAPGSRWWLVGDPSQSHSANLFRLIVGGYATLSDLACSGNPLAPINPIATELADWRRPEEVSYSYQLFAGPAARWTNASRIVVIVDRSPAVDRARRGEAINPMEVSENHRGRGQNVLFNDGSVGWLVKPVLPNGDNIWLPAAKTGVAGPVHLHGDETPADERDAFVGP